MSKGGSRPGGGRPGGRKGGAGVGPGPAYRPGSTGGGTSHKGGNTKGSASAAAPVIGIAFALFFVPGAGILSIAIWLMHARFGLF
jgi:hypothetical protein